METMLLKTEENRKRDTAELNRNLRSFHERVDAVEQVIPSLINGYSEMQTTINDHHLQFQDIWSHMDDM